MGGRQAGKVLHDVAWDVERVNMGDQRAGLWFFAADDLVRENRPTRGPTLVCSRGFADPTRSTGAFHKPRWSLRRENVNAHTSPAW